MGWNRSRGSRSPAQERQQKLFLMKGQIMSMVSVLTNLMTIDVGTPQLNRQFIVASKAMVEAARMFDKEVGWKKERKEIESESSKASCLRG